MPKTIIYVNRAAIARGKPPITVRQGRLRQEAFSVYVDGPSVVMFNPKRRQPKVWIETKSTVFLDWMGRIHPERSRQERYGS